MLTAIWLVAIVTVGVLIAGLLERNRRAVTVDQWALGGRRFGTMLVFVLMAGEIYTTFTFLGASGFAYGHGGVVFYILAYTCLGIMMSYWLLPPIWRFATERRLVTQPDFFEAKYESPLLGAVVAVVSLISLIPYLILQLKGLGIIAETLSGDRIGNHQAIAIGAGIMALYVIISGIKGSAWAAVVKDATIWIICGFLGIYLPYHYFGGVGEMFRQIEAVRPGFSALPETGQTIVWYCSTVFLSSLGLYMWPHTFCSAYTSKSEIALRKNAVLMPLYSLVMLFAMLVGFAAVLRVPGLEGREIDLSLLKLSIATFDPWMVGLIGGAGVLAAMVPGATILITGATVISNNVCWKLFPSMSPYQLANCARGSVVLITLIAVYFTLTASESIVAILILGYAIVTQLFPSLLASLLPRNPFTKEGAIAGIIVGLGTVGIVSSTGLSIATFFPAASSSIKEINVGFIAMTLNVVVAFLVSIATELPATPANKL